jgi:hypothetical protein
MHFVKYVQNSNDLDANSGITFTDGRPTIHLGGVGQVSDSEHAMLSGRGLVLETVEDPGYSKKKVDDLREEALAKGVTNADSLDKDGLVGALHAKLGEAPPLFFGPDSDDVAPPTPSAAPKPAASPSSSTN